jgi:YD repeat-containing protein
MTSSFVKIFGAACVMVSSLAPAHAQTAVPMNFSPPEVEMVDPVGVALNAGQVTFNIAPVRIGPKGDELVFRESFQGSTLNRTSGMFGMVSGSTIGPPYGPGYMIVNVLGQSEVLGPSTDGVTYPSFSKNGGVLTIQAGGGSFAYQYIDKHGVRYDFGNGLDPQICADRVIFQNGAMYEYRADRMGYPKCADLRQVTYPDGRILGLSADAAVPGNANRRFWTITRNDGFAIRVEVDATPVVNPLSVYTWGVGYRYQRPVKVTATNAAIDFCDIATYSCSLSLSWPTATYDRSTDWLDIGATTTLVVTDQAGLQTRYTEKNFLGVSKEPTTNLTKVFRMLVGIKSPTSTTGDTTTINVANQSFCITIIGLNSVTTDCSTYARDLLVQSVINAGGTWTYSYDWPGRTAPPQSEGFGHWVTTATRPNGFQTTGLFNSVTGHVHFVAASNGALNYQYETVNTYATIPNRVSSAVDSSGRSFGFTYDDRGNVLTKTQYSSDGSTSPVLTESFDATCSNRVICNKPNWTRDALGNQTDYTYDSVHGGVLTETSPPDVNGVRPQKRFTYVQRYPWLKNSSGSYTRSASPIWKLNTVSFCRTSAYTGSTCATAGDEVVTQYEYGPDAGPNNLLLRGQVVMADGSSRRTCYAYDPRGNKISETTPGAGLTSCP